MTATTTMGDVAAANPTARPPDLVVVDDLVVRTYRVEDAPELVRAVTESCEHLRPWMPWIAFEPQTVDQRIEWIRERASPSGGGSGVTYGIFEGDRIVGGTGLHHRTAADVLEIGYWVAVSHVRRGIARRVSSALTDAAFEVPGVEAVEICHDRRNLASGRVPARLGFRLVEESRRRPNAPAESGWFHRWRTTRAEWGPHPC